jgi:ribonucleotide reductase alpha subunit
MSDKYLEELMSTNQLSKYQNFIKTTIKLTEEYIKTFILRFTEKYQLTKIDVDKIVNKIYTSLPEEVNQNDFYNFAADQSVVHTSTHPEYNKLASKILAERLHNMTEEDFMKVTNILYNNKDNNGNSHQLISESYYNIVKEYHLLIKPVINYDRDYDFDYFGLRTLERAYLMRLRTYKRKWKKVSSEDIIIERPQHLFMRVAIAIHQTDLLSAVETYDYLSQRYFTHATPTLFNAGTNKPQLSSCFLISVEDSMDSIVKSLGDIMLISKWAGGIGIHTSSVRSDGAIIKGTNGISEGVVPMCKGLNWISCYVNQGGKRKGSIAVYKEPYHADIFEFCELRKNTGSEDKRCRDLFLALWIPDLFMERVRDDKMWSLMCPDECPNLNKTHGEEFNKLYESYESEGKYLKQVKARTLFKHILACQCETGFPYMLYKDHANKKSNQKNLGTIRSSNLCVSGDTYILTKEGQLPIKDYVDKNVSVWNGSEWSEVTVKKTGENQELVRVSLSNGTHLDCTPEHKFYIQELDIKEVAASELKQGDKLIKWNLPTDNNDGQELNCWKNVFNRRWIVCNNSLETYNLYKNDLIKLRLHLQTIGIESKILIDDDLWKIVINSNNVKKLIDLGLYSKPENFMINNEDNDDVEVLYVTNLLSKQDTYCFTEPLKHMGMFNGILTGQCAEIIEYSDENETAVCNLVSVCLPKYIKSDKTYDYDTLMKVCRIAIRNLNKVIDINYYPTEKTRLSNHKHRPVGLGIQGISDVFCILGYSWESKEATEINKRIFETIYYACVDESNKLAIKYGPYSTFANSPASRGELQYDMWGLKESDLLMGFNWQELKESVKKHGLRNSLLTALMPTASTAQIMGNYEGFEPYLTNMFVRTTLAGEFIVINENLVKDLEKLNLWNEDIRKLIIINNGSVQNIDIIPQNIKEIYKTAFEIKLKTIISQSADRGPFIDQSQSLNLFMNRPDFKTLASAHFYGWERGLKTGMYYLRSAPAVNPINFGIDIDDIKRLTGKESIEEIVTTTYTSNAINTKKNDDNQEDVDDGQEEQPVKMCKYIPGKNAEGCFMCSS